MFLICAFEFPTFKETKNKASDAVPLSYFNPPDNSLELFSVDSLQRYELFVDYDI